MNDRPMPPQSVSIDEAIEFVRRIGPQVVGPYLRGEVKIVVIPTGSEEVTLGEVTAMFLASPFPTSEPEQPASSIFYWAKPDNNNVVPLKDDIPVA